MESKLGNFIIGCLLLFLCCYLLFGALKGDFTLSPMTAVIFALSVMFFSLSYLQPQFKKKDERMKVIQEKGMFYSYFGIMFYFLLFTVLLGFNIIDVTAITAVQLLASLTIMTVFLSMVILSKIY